MADLLVVGAGLIGTSLGLALAGSHDVVLHDLDERHLAESVARGAGRRWDGQEPALHAVLAVPPRAIAATLSGLQRAGVAPTYSHVASVQAQVQRDLVAAGCELSTVCGTHPMAGAELPGPGLAAATLFVGRPWLLCPEPLTGSAAIEAAQQIAAACGAQVVVQSAAEHDQTVALVSHLPQVASSALAGLLRGREVEVALSGPGLRDTTRIAASDPRLWQDVLLANAGALAPLVSQLADDLTVIAAALAAAAGGAPAGEVAEVLTAMLQAGRDGRALVPVKRGGTDSDFTSVDVAVPDEPGRLAALLGIAAEVSVNIEDVTVDHLPGRPTGVIALVVRRTEQRRLYDALVDQGWVAHCRGNT